MKTDAFLPDKDRFLLYRAAQRGVFGSRRSYGSSRITDALFVYLEGAPCAQAAKAVDTEFLARPLVCLTESWEEYIRSRYPRSGVFRRVLMTPTRLFRLPEAVEICAPYRVAMTDEDAFERHPFTHGANYASYAAFKAEGSGAEAYLDGEIVASASSFLSLEGEVEMDLSTREDHRGKGLASACAARMLRDCMERGITVHWDAQNDISRHIAEKFGFTPETEYRVYFLSGETRGGSERTQEWGRDK